MTHSGPFSEWPDKARMSARDELSGAGADYFSYDLDGCLTVAIEVGCEDRVRKVAKSWGLEWHTAWQVPLGSDKPPESFRHSSWSYGGEANCWLYYRLMPQA